MLITLGSSTDLGRRESNQDSVLAVLAQNLLPRRHAAPAKQGASTASAYVQSSALLILADGMGGRASGQLASETAAKSVYRELAHTLAMQEGVDAAYLENALNGAVQQANNRIHQLAAKKAEAEGMGTTCTAALVMRDLICIGHVGDSRAYLLKNVEGDTGIEMIMRGGRTQLLTADHSVVAGEVRAGRLTEEEARSSRFRNVITRAVGVDIDVEPDVFTCPVPLGFISHLILSSDGLHGSLDDGDLEEIIKLHARSPQRAANALVSAAKRAGATDNISVIVARIDATGENYKEGAAPIDYSEESEDYQGEQYGGQSGQAAAQRKGDSPWSKLLFWQFACLALGIAVAAISLAWLFPKSSPPTPASKPPVLSPAPAPQTPQLDPATVAYASTPLSLLSRPIAPNILMALPGVPPEQGDLLVVDPKARRILRIRSSDGLVATSVPESGDFAATHATAPFPVGAIAAVDSAGDIYRFDTYTAPHPTLNKYDASGHLLKAIAPGAFSRPTALAVTPSGDVFVIDGGILKWIPWLRTQ